MRILLITAQRVFLGEPTESNTLATYGQYASQLDKLDVIVISRPGYSVQQLAGNFFAYPTNAHCLWSHYRRLQHIVANSTTLAAYDLIIADSPFFLAWLAHSIKVKFGGRCLVNVLVDFWHNPYWLQEHWYRYFLLKLGWFNLRRADAIQVPAVGFKNKLSHAGLNAAKIKISPVFIDREKFENPDNQTVASIQREFNAKKIILWPGNFSRQSNYAFVFKIVKQLATLPADFIILMVTVGRPSPKFIQLSNQANLNHRLKLINVSNLAELANYYHAADLVIQTSFFDGRGLNLWRAAAAAKAVVSSATAGAKQAVLDGQTGYLTPINNQKQFIYALSKLLTDDKLRLKLGRAAYQRFQQQFASSQLVRQTLLNWQQVIKLPTPAK